MINILLFVSITFFFNDLLLSDKNIKTKAESNSKKVSSVNDNLFKFDSVGNQCKCSAALILRLGNGENPNSLNSYGFSLLYIAASSGNIYDVKTLLKMGADINLNCDFGTALHAVASLNTLQFKPQHLKIAKFLIKEKIDVNIRDNYGTGDTALIMAARVGNIELVNLLLPLAKINFTGTLKTTPLLTAAYFASQGAINSRETYLILILMFLKAGADINIKDATGKNFLYYIGKYKRIREVYEQYLIDNV